MEKLRIVYFGSGAIGIPALRSLIHDPQFEVAAVITRPDAPAGRRMELCPTPVCKYLTDELAGTATLVETESAEHLADEASEDRILVLTPAYVKGNKPLQRFLAAVNPDALVVISYGQILTNLILNKAKWPVCVHTSALPKLRGASPVRTALLLGFQTTEVCTFLMTPRMDDGGVLMRRTIEISPDDNFRSLCENFSLEIPSLLSETLAGLASGMISPQPQNENDATYTRLISKDDAWIDWASSAGDVCNLIRAFTPDAGALTTFRGRRVKFEMPAESQDDSFSGGAPGEILRVDASAGCIEAATGSGAVRIFRIQPESRPWLSVREFVNGFSPRPGERFISDAEIIAARPPLVTRAQSKDSARGEPGKIAGTAKEGWGRADNG